MTSFAELGLPVPLVHVLSNQGMREAFPIQEATIPDVLAGRDVLGRGPTGSGKTFAFGLPTLVRLSELGPASPGAPRGLILSPTRELTMQIRQRLDEPAASLGLTVADVVGGVNINNHIRALSRRVDLLVATPGRAQDLINQGYLSLDDVRITVLDEADHMADMGFIPQVIKLLDRTPKKGQRLLFSATLDGDVDKIVNRYLHRPVTHSTAPAQAVVDTMRHVQLLVADRETHTETVARIAGREGKTIMFMRAKHRVDRQVKKLRRIGINAMGLHGDKSQGARTRAIEGFADGSVPVLVATDIAARGIDIGDVSLVVHIDPPAEHKAYVHRAGRTARAGTSGTVVTLVQPEQRDAVAALMRKANVTSTVVEVTPDSPELATITGAQKVTGAPLPPPGQPAKPKKNPKSAKSAKSGRSARNTKQPIARPRGSGRGRRRS
ncbi:DEAD/DEAH box helicase [Corynebacterium uterequi]|uniref:DNA/RNA helicase, superfamily II n=1 Tax=Corynebacterium uterequi TaxID=1072256 RepID=A0A0G3HCL7_9CORY|nr:DEAD/DEAH box helicase [Corynebacterium uterequi]AKK11059.1 DNA/RNA helicase, superfamily II [Corynebacterium uterequi]